MSAIVRIPKTGMGITEATVARWIKAEGDAVTEGEIIVEIETAKAMEEVAAPVSGVLAKILLAQGETAPVYTEIALIDEE
jgi:pyruvate/2-oxoglutarate dehydrogenase complex dihydrolipoamide acyltransferase (E2) component